MKLQNTPLGTLQFDEDGIAELVVSMNGHDVEVVVVLEAKPSEQQIMAASARVAKIRQLDVAARAAIRAELSDGDEETASVLYRSHHLEELAQATTKRLFGVEPAQVSELGFIDALQLLRVALQPGGEDAELSLDYSLGEDVTDYLLVIRFDDQDRVSCVDMES